MKKLIMLLLLIAAGCQSTNINKKKYKTSVDNTELGSIGQATSMYNLDNSFTTHSFPVLQNKVRLEVQILPFTKDINKIYSSKIKAIPSALSITYTDSLAVKPEYLTLNISDLTGFTEELNAEYNRTTINYLKDTKEAVVITGIAIALPAEDISRVKMADACYLVNIQDKKYTIALYKAGKKTDIIEMKSGTILAYTLGKFCWALTDRQQWYIGDIVNDTKGCKGNTYSKIKDKEEKNLFKL